MELCRKVGVPFEAVAKEVHKLIVTRRRMKLMPAPAYSFHQTSSKLY
jgi:hypothetical protein